MELSQKNTNRKVFIPFLIVVVGFIAYSNSFSKAFVYDDIPVILNNRSIRTLELGLPYTRIVADFSFKLNYALSGYNAADFRALNIIIHIIASLLLYGIIRRTLLLPMLYSRYTVNADIIAGVMSALWVAHPIQTESVTYICQRYESLMGLFYLLTLYCFIRGVNEKESSNRVWLDCSLLSAILGMGTKEVMITAPVVVFIYDAMFVAGTPVEALRRRLMFYLALLGTLGIFALLWIGTLARSISSGVPVKAPISNWHYLLTQSQVLVHYLKVALLLEPSCLDHGWQLIREFSIALPESIFLISLLGLSIYASCRRIPHGFAGLFFFIVLAPTSSFIPIYDLAVDHRMYLPLSAVIVVCIATIYFILKMILNRLKISIIIQNIVYLTAGAMLIVVLVIATIKHNEIYRSEFALWNDVLGKRPQNLRAHLGICSSLLKEGKLQEAEICGYNLLAYINKLEKRASNSYVGLIKDDIQQVHVSVLNNLGVCRYNSGDYREGIKYFQHALQICPRYIPARENLALALNQIGETNRARSEFLQLLCDDPDNALALQYLEINRNKKGNSSR